MDDAERPSGTSRDSCGDRPGMVKLLTNLTAYVLPAVIGAALLAGTILENSATYDEVAYVRIACRWWRTGDQTEITRMGSPVTFWKCQAVPALAFLDATGRGGWIDTPRTSLPESLPWFRVSAAWLWFAGLGVVQVWAKRAYGTRASFFAGLLYALGPNMRAHGALMTMETPLWTCIALATMCLCESIRTRRRAWRVASAVSAGAAFSMKFTGVALPVLFAGIVALREIADVSWSTWPNRRSGVLRVGKKTVRFGVEYLALMILTNLVLTGFATIPLSERTGRHPWLESRFHPSIARNLQAVLETPIPVDWVGFATQMRHQRSGGPGYLFGETSTQGWPWYYLVAMGVKCPPFILLVLAIRPLMSRRNGRPEEWVVPLLCLAFIAAACLSSKRNYGYRYLLPLAPVAIVWISAAAKHVQGRIPAMIAVAAAAWASVMCHPYELTYFNALAGGRSGGHRILADSNLDWGQGLIAFRKLVAAHPELSDVTLFAFGDIEPAVYGIDVASYAIDASDKFGHLPETVDACRTKYVAISTSLIFGPWGPKGFFGRFVEETPVATTADGTIRFYRLSR